MLKTKQDITAFDDYLWRLKVGLDRVQCIGPYPLALRKRTIDNVLKDRDQLASSVQELMGSNLNNGKKAVQLGPLREAVYQLEDLADDIEYIWWKPYHANSLIRKLRLVLKLRKTEELLKDLRVIIEDFQNEFKSEKGKALTAESNKGYTKKYAHDDLKAHDLDVITENQYLSQGKECCEISKDQCKNDAVHQNLEAIGSSEISEEKYSSNKFDGQHNTKDQLIERLLQQGGDPVIPFEVSQETMKGTIPVYDIFNDKRIRKEFGLLLYVRASDGPSHQGTLTESILNFMNANVVHAQSALHKDKCGKCRCCTNTKVDRDRSPEEGSSNWSEAEEVKELQEKFSQFSEQEKMFLLVLEDVLEDQLPQLDHLLSALLSRNAGSRIVISSQSSEVLESVNGIKISNDGSIQVEIFWNFFRSFAFRDAKEGEDEEMKHTAKMMATYLKCFPLAAKMVAKMLNTNRDHQFWTVILGKLHRVVKTDCENRQLLSLLKICYDELPAPLRICFQYCSLFPKNWTFTCENLVQLWMSQGFLVEDSNNWDTVEDVGRKYFDKLFLRSFFEELIYDGHTPLYRLHASVHCFAQVTAGEEFMRIESDIRPEESLCARHLSVQSANLSSLHNVDAIFRLRTLIIFGPINSDACQTLKHILPRLKNTRTLDLAGCEMKEFPELAIDLRKHLRFLRIYDTDIDNLPDDFSEFFHLQVLNVQGSRIKKFPCKMARLHNLRHISGPTFLTSEFSHIGKLKDLQELEEFAVSKKHKIQELGGMKDLRGSISITNLERVTFINATKARLHEKRRLDSLKLEWSDTVMHSSSICGIKTLGIKRFMSSKVLERLKPSSDILNLEINRYIGVKLPRWFSVEVLQNIQTITLRNFMNLVEPPPMGQLPRLKTLKMENWKKLNNFPQKEGIGDPGFPQLIELSLEDMPELEVWADCHKGFPRLELLTIRHCPELKEIQLLKSSVLKEIYVEDVGLEDLPLQVDTSISLANPASLKRLTIQGCQSLSTVGGNYDDARYLPSTLLRLQITDCENIEHIDFKGPICLQQLHINGCKKLKKLTINSVKGDLTSLGTVHLDKISLLAPYYKHLVCLEELVIEGEILDSLDELPKSRLRKLFLIQCQDDSLFAKGEDKAFPKDMEEFKSLKCLHLKQCYKMKSLPYLPYNLDELHIDECPLLEKQCREDGPGWSSISHVPYKYM